MQEHLKEAARRAHGTFLKGLVGSTKPESGSDPPTPLQQVAHSSEPQPQKIDLRTFDRSQLTDDHPSPEANRPTINLESSHQAVEALKALFDELGTPVLVIVIGVAVRVGLRFFGDSRAVLICIVAAVMLTALVCTVVWPYKKRLPLHVMLSLLGLWAGGYI